jgi:hypothetical protein
VTNERTTITVRMDTDLHDWLMDHRDSTKRSLSDAIREVIDYWINCQNDDNLTGSYIDEGKTMEEIRDEVNGIHNRMLMSVKYNDAFESDKWRKLIPAFKIKPDWLIQIIPPFTGAIIRFRIQKEGFTDHQFISVYLDCYELLGYYGGGSPYWKAYPVDDDTWRCAMDDIDCLMEGIEKGLQQIEEENNKEEDNDRQSNDT